MKFFPEKIASSSLMDRHIASSAVSIPYNYGFSIQASYSGPNPNGLLYLQASNDTPQNNLVNTSPTTYTRIDDSIVVVSSTGTTMWNYSGAEFRWVQMRFLASTAGSSGILTATAVIKSI